MCKPLDQLAIYQLIPLKLLSCLRLGKPGVSDGLPNTGRVLNLMHVVLLMNCYAMVS